ncbi:hypothetical protein GN958_ATG19056, partial [Phytophthora infestans]
MRGLAFAFVDVRRFLVRGGLSGVRELDYSERVWDADNALQRGLRSVASEEPEDLSVKGVESYGVAIGSQNGIEAAPELNHEVQRVVWSASLASSSRWSLTVGVVPNFFDDLVMATVGLVLSDAWELFAVASSMLAWTVNEPLGSMVFRFFSSGNYFIYKSAKMLRLCITGYRSYVRSAAVQDQLWRVRLWKTYEAVLAGARCEERTLKRSRASTIQVAGRLACVLVLNVDLCVVHCARLVDRGGADRLRYFLRCAVNVRDRRRRLSTVVWGRGLNGDVHYKFASNEGVVEFGGVVVNSGAILLVGSVLVLGLVSNLWRWYKYT